MNNSPHSRPRDFNTPVFATKPLPSFREEEGEVPKFEDDIPEIRIEEIAAGTLKKNNFHQRVESLRSELKEVPEKKSESSPKDFPPISIKVLPVIQPEAFFTRSSPTFKREEESPLPEKEKCEESHASVVPDFYKQQINKLQYVGSYYFREENQLLRKELEKGKDLPEPDDNWEFLEI